MDNMEAEIIRSGLVASFLAISLCFLFVKRLTFTCFKNKSLTEKVFKIKPTGWEKLPNFPVFRTLRLAFDMRTAIEKTYQMEADYGPVIKAKIYGEDYAILTKPHAIQKLLSSKDEGHITKSPRSYEVIKDTTGNGILMSTGELWHSKRKLFAKAFSYSALKTYLKIHNKCALRFVSKLEKIDANNGFSEYQQINWLIHECGFEIISETVMGLDVIVSPEDSAMMFDSINSTKETGMIRLIFKSQSWLASLFHLHPASKKYRMGVNNMDKIIKKMIVQFRNQMDKETVDVKDDTEDSFSFECMLTFMLNSGLSEDVILDEVKTMLLAGYETTSTAIHYLFFMLALHQNHQNACREEIIRVLDKCPDGQLTMEALSELKYLERCIQETLRVYPVPFMIARKLDTPLTIDEDMEIPSGTNVIVSILHLHRSPEYFPNPDEFQPDRFLLENSTGRHQFAFAPFSAGPRSCIGMKFALMEAKIMAAHVLRKFELYTSDTMSSVKNLPSVLLKPERDFYFRLKKHTLSEKETRQ